MALKRINKELTDLGRSVRTLVLWLSAGFELDFNAGIHRG